MSQIIVASGATFNDHCEFKSPDRYNSRVSLNERKVVTLQSTLKRSIHKEIVELDRIV